MQPRDAFDITHDTTTYQSHTSYSSCIKNFVVLETGVHTGAVGVSSRPAVAHKLIRSYMAGEMTCGKRLLRLGDIIIRERMLTELDKKDFGL